MADEGEGKKDKGGTPIILVALLLVNTLVTLAVLAFTLMKSDGGGAAAAPPGDGGPVAEAPAGDGGPASRDDDDDEGALVPMDTITLQLRNPEVPRYVRLDLQIEVPTVDDIPKVDRKMAALRDAVIKHLADQSYETMRGSSGLDRVKASVLKVAHQIVGEEVVRAIYVTNFVVQ